jgi:hypothetical protein
MEEIIRFYAVLVAVGIVYILVLAFKGVEEDPVERRKDEEARNRHRIQTRQRLGDR